MENIINIAELLKNCPKGMELDCLMYEDVHFDYVDELNIIHCYIRHETYKTSITFNQRGTHNNEIKSKCVIFPKGKTTWEGFVPPCEFKDGDIMFKDDFIAIIYSIGKKGTIWYHCWYNTQSKNCKLKNDRGIGNINDRCEIRFATEEEKQKLFDALKANGYKWNTETKALEKLATNKFGISTLKPFDKVLVRNSGLDLWSCAFYSHYEYEEIYAYKVCTNIGYQQCIPYKGNEHLLGTRDDCDECYINWL